MWLCSVSLHVKAQTRHVYERKLIRLMTGDDSMMRNYSDDYDEEEEEEEDDDDADEVDLEGEELLVLYNSSCMKTPTTDSLCRLLAYHA